MNDTRLSSSSAAINLDKELKNGSKLKYIRINNNCITDLACGDDKTMENNEKICGESMMFIADTLSDNNTLLYYTFLNILRISRRS